MDDDIKQLIQLLSDRLDSKDELDKMHSAALHRLNAELIQLREIVREFIQEISTREDYLQALIPEITTGNKRLLNRKHKLIYQLESNLASLRLQEARAGWSLEIENQINDTIEKIEQLNAEIEYLE